jgi:hypothetical protein
MTRTLALALAVFALTAGEAQGSAPATEFEVVVVPGLTLADLPELEQLGAVGLLVPGAGPETSAELAHAALVRGETRNSLRGGLPTGPPLIEAPTGALGSVEGPAIYLGLPEGGRQANDRRYPILVAGRGYDGILTSESTRIPGLVSVVDVAPTALGAEDALAWEAEAEATAALVDLDESIDAHNDVRLWALLLACALVVVLALGFPAAAVPACATLLLANLALGLADLHSAWAILLVVALAVLVGGPLLAPVSRSPLLLGLVLAGTLLAYLVAFAADGPSVALSPFGPSQNARFYGLSNLLETLLLVPALGGAALLGGLAGWPGFAAVAVLALVTVTGNDFGADGGGAIVLAAGFVALAVLVAHARRRALAVVPVAAAAAVGLILVFDLATGSSSHVTDAVRDGPGSLAGDLRDRIVLSYERVTEDWYVALAIGGLFVALALLVVRTLRRKGAGPDAAVPLALATAVATSLVVNDSPLEVLLVGAVAYLATDLGMLPARWPGRSRSRWSPLPLLSPRGAGAATQSRPSRRT